MSGAVTLLLYSAATLASGAAVAELHDPVSWKWRRPPLAERLAAIVLIVFFLVLLASLLAKLALAFGLLGLLAPAIVFFAISPLVALQVPLHAIETWSVVRACSAVAGLSTLAAWRLAAFFSPSRLPPSSG
ncbi:hypothetical protein NYQ83_12230 [Afifella sp. JA880]|uniref:hypothetical protein n=1 Tax=Afifella sp. JA880 TaxID=2975280 RepID=UPI0021BAEBAD|nr:hypothetical protein [Afifella sp. JA880]MCT8268042.1 hypothetical protein [Afifella sp. JA880]